MSARGGHTFRTLTPFLYPFTDAEILRADRCFRSYSRVRWPTPRLCRVPRRYHSASSSRQAASLTAEEPDDLESRLNPSPDSFKLPPFTDRCTVTLHAGPGGHGCVSFLREKFIEEGPANGGDGGSGGNIFIQAVRGETSLHKLARKKEIKAGRGKNGQGSSQGGHRGEDVLIQVPVGTVIREIARSDPVAEEERLFKEEKKRIRQKRSTTIGGVEVDTIPGSLRRDKWLLYPGANPLSISLEDLPDLPAPARSNLAAMEPAKPIRLDLDEAMERPMLLAAGALGGMGNPCFVTKEKGRPKFATKGSGGLKLTLHFELKLLADVGLVGLPNAGKSTLLRSLSNSRTRVGNWAFTTLQPNIGTVVLDDHKGRPRMHGVDREGRARTKYTIADIPGLIEDAHLNKGLGLDFLRHVERASVLAFVIDLSAGDAVKALKALWKEVAEFDVIKGRDLNEHTQKVIEWQPTTAPEELESLTDPDEAYSQLFGASDANKLPELILPPVTSKPWFVVATKADLPETQSNFHQLQDYLRAVKSGLAKHPARKTGVWKGDYQVVPVSAICAEGVEQVSEVVLKLLNA